MFIPSSGSWEVKLLCGPLPTLVTAAISHQRRRKMLEVGGHAEGSGIEACSGDQFVRSAEKKFRLHFSVIRMGSRGTFVLCTDAPGSML